MTVASETEMLRKEFDQLRLDVVALTNTLKEIASDRGGAAYEKLRRSTHGAEEQAARAAEAMGREIGERPLASVLGAFGIGVLLGVLFGRRS